jgi:hypothetical protein
MPKLLKETFKAWVDRMPGSPPKLIVIGVVEVPTLGWKVDLVRAEPQGINPDILLLDIRAVAPGGDVPQVISKIKVRYEESPPQRKYSQVDVRDGADHVVIDEIGETS